LQETLISHYVYEMTDKANEVLRKKGQKILESWDEKKAIAMFEKSYMEIQLANYSKSTCFPREEIERFNETGNKVNELWKYKGVKRLLTTAEWEWNNHKHLFEKDDEASITDDIGQEFTYIVANYIKSVEIFLMNHLENIKGRKGNLPLIEVFIKGKKESVEIGSADYRKYVTMGNFYTYIEKQRQNDDVLKIGVRKSRVVGYMKEWVNHVRNSHFHKDTIESIGETRVIRIDTILILKRLIADLK